MPLSEKDIQRSSKQQERKLTLPQQLLPLELFLQPPLLVRDLACPAWSGLLTCIVLKPGGEVVGELGVCASLQEVLSQLG